MRRYINQELEVKGLDEEEAFLRSLGLDDSDIEIIKAGRESRESRIKWN